MKRSFTHRSVLIVGAVCLSAFLGARTVAQEVAGKNYERDVVEFDRTRDQIAANFVAKADVLKQVAREVSALDQGEENKKVLDGKIEKALQGLFQDAFSLALQTHLLALDTVADRGPAEEGAILGMLATRFKVPIAEIVERREKTGLGLGGVAIGYAIALAAQVPPDEIFTNKQGNRTWMDVMSHRQVTLEQLKTVFEKP